MLQNKCLIKPKLDADWEHKCVIEIYEGSQQRTYLDFAVSGTEYQFLNQYKILCASCQLRENVSVEACPRTSMDPQNLICQWEFPDL